MIEEDYVSYDIAKLLKENGFNEPCWGYYVKSHIDHYFRPVKNSEWTSDKYSAPTLQMAMKWLREVYHIHIEIHLDSMDGRHPIYEALYSECITIRTDNFIDYGDTYEEAVEAALEYCLTNLIKL